MKIGLRHVIAIIWCFSFVQYVATASDGVSSEIEGSKEKKASITRYKIEPLYRAARLSWKAKIRSDGPVVFEIYRSIATPEGPYRLIGSVPYKPTVKRYRYVDKNLPVEENYFYIIKVPATGESFGPLQVRPPFSLPTT